MVDAAVRLEMQNSIMNNNEREMIGTLIFLF